MGFVWGVAHSEHHTFLADDGSGGPRMRNDASAGPHAAGWATGHPEKCDIPVTDTELNVG